MKVKFYHDRPEFKAKRGEIVEVDSDVGLQMHQGALCEIVEFDKGPAAAPSTTKQYVQKVNDAQ